MIGDFMNKQFLAVMLAVPIFTSELFAESQQKNIESVLVTATRTASSIDETLAPVSVIDRKKIEQLQELKDIDFITEEEFKKRKNDLLNSFTR